MTRLLAPPLNRLICGCLLQLRPSQRLELGHPFGTLELHHSLLLTKRLTDLLLQCFDLFDQVMVGVRQRNPAPIWNTPR